MKTTDDLTRREFVGVRSLVLRSRECCYIREWPRIPIRARVGPPCDLDLQQVDVAGDRRPGSTGCTGIRFAGRFNPLSEWPGTPRAGLANFPQRHVRFHLLPAERDSHGIDVGYHCVAHGRLHEWVGSSRAYPPLPARIGRS